MTVNGSFTYSSENEKYYNVGINDSGIKVSNTV